MKVAYRNLIIVLRFFVVQREVIRQYTGPPGIDIPPVTVCFGRGSVWYHWEGNSYFAGIARYRLVITKLRFIGSCVENLQVCGFAVWYFLLTLLDSLIPLAHFPMKAFHHNRAVFLVLIIKS